MDIYITEIDTGRKIQLPALPTAISYNGTGRFMSYEIMGKGTVEVPDGRMLKDVSWEGFLPGELRKNEPWIRKYTDAKTLDDTFIEWLDKQPALKLVVTDTNINMDCHLASYQGTPNGGYSDINYSISFKQKDDILVSYVTTKEENKDATTRTTKGQGSTYTVKKGDCLWSIAKAKLGKGSLWQSIYNANKEIIESTAKKHGKSSSNNGHWIYPGTVLTIPS